MKSRLLLETSRFSVYQHDTPTPQGGVRRRQVIQHPGSAVILPLLDDSRAAPQVVLIKNFRVAVGKTLIELPAGTLEPPEPALETAKRELIEETGYAANRWSPLPALYMSPGILHEQMHCYLAQDLQPGSPQREVGEEIENLVVSLDEAVEMVRKGEIVDAKTVAVLLYWRAFGADALS